VVAKLKSELDESSSSLKATLEAMESLDEKYRQVNTEANKAKNKVAALEAELQAEKVDRLKVEEDMLRLSKRLLLMSSNIINPSCFGLVSKASTKTFDREPFNMVCPRPI